MNTTQLILFLVQFVTILSNIIIYAIFGRILLSWVSVGSGGGPQKGGRLTQMLHDITEPVIRLARKVPHRWGMMDFAPIIAIFAVDILSRFILIGLYGLA